MQRQSIIVLHKGDTYEAWGSLTDLCNKHPDFSYYYIKAFKFPFEYKGYKFIKVPFRALND